MTSPSKREGLRSASATKRTPNRKLISERVNEKGPDASGEAKRKLNFANAADEAIPLVKSPRKRNASKKDDKANGQHVESTEDSGLSLVQFEDELGRLSTKTAVENYFNLGKVKKSVNRKRRNKKGRLHKQAIDENEENADPCEEIECDLEQVRDWLQIADSHLPKEVRSRRDAISDSFAAWLGYLSAGFNLMLYGVGSKRDVLQRFCDEALGDCTYVLIDAFHPYVNARIILQCLETNLNVKNRCRSSSIVEWASALATTIERRDDDVVLVLNNIDGPDLRENTQQWALAVLARCPRVHLVASCDHLNAPLLWNQDMRNAFNFLYVHTSTMVAYKEEIMAGDSKLLGLSAKTSARAHTQASLDVVWASLTFNSRMVLYKVARVFYASLQPIEFFDLYRRAREDFLVSSETALRQQLVELEDHRLVGKKRGQDGNEYVSMNADRKVMSGFLESKGLIMEADEEEDA